MAESQLQLPIVPVRGAESDAEEEVLQGHRMLLLL